MAAERYSFGTDETYAFYVVNGQLHCYWCALHDITAFDSNDIVEHLKGHEQAGDQVNESLLDLIDIGDWDDGPVVFYAPVERWTNRSWWMGKLGNECLLCFDCPVALDFFADSLTDALNHLQDHRNQGHPLPVWVDDFLVSETAWSGSTWMPLTRNDDGTFTTRGFRPWPEIPAASQNESDMTLSGTDAQVASEDSRLNLKPGWYPDPHQPEEIIRYWDGHQWTPREHGFSRSAWWRELSPERRWKFFDPSRSQPPHDRDGTKETLADAVKRTKKQLRPPSWKSLAVLALGVGSFPAILILSPLVTGFPPLVSVAGSVGMAIGALSLAKDAEWEIGQSGGHLGGEGFIEFGKTCAMFFLLFMGLGLLTFLAGSLM